MDHTLYEYSAMPSRRPLSWPGNRPLAFWVVLYIEHWELDPPPGSHRPPGIQGVRESIFPDYRTYSHRDYGNRVGVFRIIEIFEELGIQPTVAVNASICEVRPRLLREFIDRDWEIAAHGTYATRMISSRMSESEERDYISSTIEQINRATGRRPLGWIGQDFGESTRTPTLVAEQGLSYISDWPNDDQPYPMLHGPGLVSLPQHAQWDDVLLLWVRQVSSIRYPMLVGSACDKLIEEGARSARMLGLGVHPWLSGQAHRIKYLKQAIEDVMARPGVWPADGRTIADHYRTWLGQGSDKEEK